MHGKVALNHDLVTHVLTQKILTGIWIYRECLGGTFQGREDDVQDKVARGLTTLDMIGLVTLLNLLFQALIYFPVFTILYLD